MFEQTIYGDSESSFNDLSNHIKTFVYKFRSEFSVGFQMQDCVFHTLSISHNAMKWSFIQYIQYCIYECTENSSGLYESQVGLPAGTRYWVVESMLEILYC